MKLTVVVRFTQELVWFLFRVYLLVSRSTFTGNVDLKPGYGYIIASNHRSQLDPFVIGAAFPYVVYHRLRPIWFMAYRELFTKPLMRWGLLLCGAFPTKPIHGLAAGLEFSTLVLEKGGTICIFPEGKRTLPGSTEPKRGVSVLSQIKNVELIPVYLDWQKGRWLRKAHIAFGEALDASRMTPSEIMQLAYSLAPKGEAASAAMVE